MSEIKRTWIVKRGLLYMKMHQSKKGIYFLEVPVSIGKDWTYKLTKISKETANEYLCIE